MCGFAGYLSDQIDANLAIVSKMVEKVNSRGPDSDGFWLDPKNIYADFKSGRRENVIGLDIDAEKPSQPELVFNERNVQSPEQMAEFFISCIKSDF